MLPTVKKLIETLGLEPLPQEGGYFYQTYKSKHKTDDTQRAYSSAIYYLLPADEFSAFHVLYSDEMWHFYAGDILSVVSITPAGDFHKVQLGSDVLSGQMPQLLIPGGVDFASFIEPHNQRNGYSLVGCTVTPGFEFADFKLSKPADLLERCPEQAKLIQQLTR